MVPRVFFDEPTWCVFASSRTLFFLSKLESSLPLDRTELIRQMALEALAGVGEKYISVMRGREKRRRSEAEKSIQIHHEAVLCLPGCENARGCPCWI